MASDLTNNGRSAMTERQDTWPEAIRRWLHHRGGWIRLVSAALIVLGLLVLVRQLPIDRLVRWLIAWVEGLGVWGALAFAGAYIVAVVVFVPGSAITLAAGALFGLLWGTVIVSLASTTAAALAFLISRYLARDRVRRWAQRYPRFGAIDRAIGEGGWRIVALLRLSPAVPYTVSNYLYGLTAVRFGPYVLASWLAMLPGTFLYVYLGYIGRAGLVAAAEGETGRSVWEWVMLGAGLVATAVVTVYITRLARRAIREQTPLEEEGDSAAADAHQPEAGPPRGWPWGTIGAAALALAVVTTAAIAYVNREAVRSLLTPPAISMSSAHQFAPTLRRRPHADNWLAHHDPTAIIHLPPVSDHGQREAAP